MTKNNTRNHNKNIAMIHSAFDQFNAGDHQSALNICNKLLRKNTKDVGALNLIGIIKDNLNEKETAIKYFKKASCLTPQNADILGNIGIASFEINNYGEAKTYLIRSLAINDNNSVGHNLLGKMYEKDDTEKALFHMEKSFLINPKQDKLAINIGLLNLKIKKFTEAHKWLKRGLTLNPTNADALNALGVVEQEFGYLDAASTLYSQAIKNKPDSANGHNNLGYLLLTQQKTDAAQENLLKALSLAPDSQEIKNNLSMLELLTRQFKDGWQHYRFRNAVKDGVYDLPPENSPENITGKKILILREQGIGDELFFLRFITQLTSLSESTSYLPCPKLTPLLKKLNIVDSILEEMPDKKTFDVCISVGDLPYLLNHNIDNTPPPLSLTTNNDALDIVNGVLSEFGPPPYVGLTWRAGGIVNNTKTGSYIKDIELTTLCQAVKNRPGTIIAIQKGAQHSEFEFIASQLNRPVLNAAIYHDDLEKMLALLSIIDTYISVSNTNIHLREGLGKISDVLVCSPPEWRWENKGKTSLWFPNSRIHRQTADGDWTNAITELVSAQ